MNMNLLDLIQDDGFDPDYKGSTNGGECASPCPFCGGKDRFLIWPNNRPEKGGRFWCRACERHGDAITYLREQKGMSYRDACALIGIKSGLRSLRSQPPSRIKKDSTGLSTKTSVDPPLIWQRMAAAIVQEGLAGWQTPRGFDAFRFLSEQKGLTWQTIVAYRLGFNPAVKYIPRKLWGLPLDNSKKSVWLPPGVIIPLQGCNTILRLRFRTDDPDMRYYIVPGSSTAPYLLGYQGPNRPLVVLESELDAILLSQVVGDIVNVAALGSAQARPDPFLDNEARTAPLLFCLLDFDKAGETASKKWQQTYAVNYRRPILPTGKDPSDAYKAGVDLRAWLTSLIPTHLQQRRIP